MPDNRVSKYELGLIGLVPSTITKPDTYLLSTNKPEQPNKDFIISCYKDGSILSRYGDDIWDLTPYRLIGHSRSTKLLFLNLPRETINDSKWLIFILMYMAESGRSSCLSVSTIINYMKMVFVARKKHARC